MLLVAISEYIRMTYKYLSMSNDVTELQILQFNRENVIYFFFK